MNNQSTDAGLDNHGTISAPYASSQSSSSKPLLMKFAAGTVKHFGLQMYSTAVPAIAEMVANSWDADAHNTWIKIPLEQPISAEFEITVRDDGSGMSYDDCVDKYLVVGRDRRESEESDRTPGNRPVMGHKGLGKFAPFGIADIVEVRTVRDGRLTHFRMDYRNMVPPKGSPAEQLVQSYAPEPVALDVPVNESSGTAIILRNLRLKRRVDADNFFKAMARRFTCISADYFSVYINEQILAPFSIDLDYRIPPKGWTEETLPEGSGDIRWWVGFTPYPVVNDELRGISVVVRGKVAQTPFFFQTSRGVTGQHGLQYMVGVVEAEFLDQEDDLVSTDRASVLWEHQKAQPLLRWGQERIPEWLRDWANRRAKLRLDRLRAERPTVAAILESVSSYPRREREQLEALVNKLATMVEDDRELEWAVASVEGAYQDRRFMEFVEHLNSIEEAALPDILRLLREYEVLEAMRLAQVAAARIEIIRTFENLIATQAREKPDMQDIVARNPWLLDPTWQVLRHEAAIDTIASQILGVQPEEDELGNRRLDFFCLADSLRVVVVEVKRPGRRATLEEWHRFTDYVAQLETHYVRITEPRHRRIVQGLFVATDMDETAKRHAERDRGQTFRYTDWSSLLRAAEQMQREYLDALTTTASTVNPGDPRLRSIRQLVKDNSSAILIDPSASPSNQTVT